MRLVARFTQLSHVHGNLFQHPRVPQLEFSGPVSAGIVRFTQGVLVSIGCLRSYGTLNPALVYARGCRQDQRL